MEEVKRKANPGEYIKLTNDAGFVFNRAGDILKVHSSDDLVRVLGKDHPRDTGDDNYKWSYTENEYVVLEGYEPNDEEKPKFKVGDRVRFRDWDDMVKEFETDKDGNIIVMDSDGFFVRFVKQMKYLCGTYATIEEIDGRDVMLTDFTDIGDTDWRYTIGMFKLAEEETLKTFEMVAKAEGDGQTYENDGMTYSREEGFKNARIGSINSFIRKDGWKAQELRKEMTLEEIEKELGYKIKIK